MTGSALAIRGIDDLQRVAKAYAMSGYWPDSRDVAQAFVKVSFGYEVGLPAYVAMSEVHIIQGKPTLGAGALAALVKGHPDYDYRVLEHTEEVCEIAFYQAGANGFRSDLGTSRFTMDDAKTAGLTSNPTWKKYPRNMLFARAISNGVAWFTPDVTMGRVYTPEEMGALGEGDDGATAPTPGSSPSPSDAADDIEDAVVVDAEPSPADLAVEPADIALWQAADRLEAALFANGEKLAVDLDLIRESVAGKRSEHADDPELLVAWLEQQVGRAQSALDARHERPEEPFKAPSGPRGGGNVTASQLRILQAARDAGLSDEDRHRITADVAGVSSSKDVPRGMVDAVVAALKGAGEAA